MTVRIDRSVALGVRASKHNSIRPPQGASRPPARVPPGRLPAVRPLGTPRSADSRRAGGTSLRRAVSPAAGLLQPGSLTPPGSTWPARPALAAAARSAEGGGEGSALAQAHLA